MKPEEYSELQQLIASLTERVYKLEQRAGIQTARAEQAAPTRLTSPTTFERPLFQAGSAADSHPDLESAIGANWLNRIGIVAVLIGVSYFLKYAFDNAWVGPAGRVVIGLLSGLGMVYWSEYFRRKIYVVFSHSLKAIGIGILYLSLWASSQLYALVSVEIAALGMVAVTACTVAMALLLSSEILAGLATLGGFLTPLLLSTGNNNALALFAYIAMLDVGLLLLWRQRSWSRVVLGGFIGTLVLTVIWYSQYYTPDQFVTAFIAGSVFFAIFFLLPFADSKQDPTGLGYLDALTLANGASYFFWTWSLFDSIGRPRVASLSAIALAAICFLFATRISSDSLEPGITFTKLLRAMGISFLILAVPIGLEAQWITIGWFVEAATLVWAGRRLSGNHCTLLGSVALGLGLFRLLLVDRFDATRLIFNERMFVYAVGVAVLIGIAKMIATAGRKEELAFLPTLIVATNILVLLALNLEISDAFRRQLEMDAASTGLRIARDFAYSALWMSYGALLMFIGFWKNSQFFRWQALLLIALSSVKVFLYDTISLDRGYRIVSFIALGLLLLGTSFFYQRDWFKLKDKMNIR